MAHRITEKQQKILNAVGELQKTGGPITYRKLSEACGMHLTYVYMSILSLEKKGKVTRNPNEHGSIRLKKCKISSKKSRSAKRTSRK